MTKGIGSQLTRVGRQDSAAEVESPPARESRAEAPPTAKREARATVHSSDTVTKAPGQKTSKQREFRRRTTGTALATSADEALAKSGSAKKVEPGEMLDRIGKLPGVDPKEIAKLKQFANDHGVSLSELVTVGTQGRYRGREKLEAMKMFAVAYDAVANQRLAPERAKGFRQHLLPALKAGRLHVKFLNPAQAKTQESHAAYSHNSNTLSLKPAGIDLNSPIQRSVLVHEGQHVVQDARMEKGKNRFEYEHDAHKASMDYLLRTSGAMRPNQGGGFILDFAVYAKLMADVDLSAPDKKCFADQFEAALVSNLRDGRSQLHRNLGSVQGLSTASTADLRSWLRSSDPHSGSGFDVAYAERGPYEDRAQQRNQFSVPYDKHGLIP